MSFGNFLKQLDQSLYNEYNQEKYLNREVKSEPEFDISKINHPKFRFESPLRKLKKVSQLEHDHPVKRYVVKRKIPPNYHHKLFYAPKFKQWINSIVPGKFNGDAGDEPRLIIPFIDNDDTCFGIQGRSFKPDGLRYITIMFDESKPKIFGLDTVNDSQRVYILEGPIDSMFIENSVAMAGADIGTDKFMDEWAKDRVYVYDNEPRNQEIHSRMSKVIKEGYSIVIWPDTIKQKDVNDAVLAGIDVEDVLSKNIYKDLEAQLKFNYWKKNERRNQSQKTQWHY
jgi:hypothetical protein